MREMKTLLERNSHLQSRLAAAREREAGLMALGAAEVIQIADKHAKASNLYTWLDSEQAQGFRARGVAAELEAAGEGEK